MGNDCDDHDRNNGTKTQSLCCRLSSSSLSSSLLLVVIIPLIVISGFVAFLGPNGSLKSRGISVISDVKGLRSNMVMEEAVSGDSLLNRSSSPSKLAVEDFSDDHDSRGDEELNGTQESGFNDSKSETEHVPLANTSYVPLPSPEPEPELELVPLVNISSDSLPKPERRKEITHLARLEGRLMKARSAISEAKIGNQTEDPEYVPIGPIYHNAKAFHRSYLEMEKEFKVYVYEEGEPPLFHNGPCKSIYSMEGNFIHGLEMNTRFRTREPHKAHVFFLPFSITMLVRYVYNRESRDFHSISRTVNDYIDIISQKYPFWNRSLAADHFMLSCHDWGPEASRSNPNLHKNAIRALCNANTSEGFDLARDVSFPEINLLSGYTDGLLGGPSPSRRSILAFFAGGVHGPIRPILLEHWENKDDPDMKIQQYLPKGVSYYDMLRRSKFCVCPSGYEVASPRIVEAIYTGCVPVLVSDHYAPPFGDVLNWRSFSVEVSVKDIPNLKRILTSITPTQYIRMQRRVQRVRRHFEVNSPPKRFDVFHMILHSVWLRRLNVRVPE